MKNVLFWLLKTFFKKPRFCNKALFQARGNRSKKSRTTSKKKSHKKKSQKSHEEKSITETKKVPYNFFQAIYPQVFKIIRLYHLEVTDVYMNKNVEANLYTNFTLLPNELYVCYWCMLC